MCCKSCSVTQRKLWVFGCGSFVALLAILLGLLWPALYLKILHSELVLKEGSMNYKNWISTPIPMYLEIYMFNWDNPEEVNNKDVKPKFTEMGPYTFLERHTRVDLNWNDNGTVSFNQIRTWEFVPEQSKGKLDDRVLCPNAMSATVAYMMRNKPKAMKIIANLILETQGGAMIHDKTVREWLFDGFKDPLLTFLKKANTSEINIPFNEFGWFVDRNGSKTYDGRFTMSTGENVISDLGKITLWNGDNKTRFYSDECGTVNGTSGELWPPGLNPDKTKTIFVTDICRQITLYPAGSVTKLDVEGAKFIADDHAFDNGQKYETNKCYCKEYKKDDGKENSENVAIDYESATYSRSKDKESEKPQQCLIGSGVLDVSECRYGAPVFVSYPHFYLADPKFVDDIDGMAPNKDKHQLTMSLEPFLGVPLEVNARLQINLLMQKYPEYSLYKEIPEPVMMPLFWFKQRAELDESLAKQVTMVLNLRNLGEYVAYGLGSLGLLIIVVGVALTALKKWKTHTYEDEEPLSN